MKKFNIGGAIQCFKKDEFANQIPTTAGIYQGSRGNPELNKYSVYIGQAKNLRKRYFAYYLTIKFGRVQDSRPITLSLYKHNWKMKWTKEPQGTYRVVETCGEDMLDIAEKRGIDYFKVQNVEMKNLQGVRTDKQVQTNARRITQIKNKQFKTLQQCFKYLTIKISPNGLKIGLKLTKKGVPTALSKKYFEKLLEELGINNEKQKNL